MFCSHDSTYMYIRYTYLRCSFSLWSLCGIIRNVKHNWHRNTLTSCRIQNTEIHGDMFWVVCCNIYIQNCCHNSKLLFYTLKWNNDHELIRYVQMHKPFIIFTRGNENYSLKEANKGRHYRETIHFLFFWIQNYSFPMK